jgi:hypothetical protein
MRDAITCPAERLLRFDSGRGWHGRGYRKKFSVGVTARLLKGLRAISDDPILPLLQHVLARVWQAAVARAWRRASITARPHRVADLVVASALPAALAPPVGDEVNVLRGSGGWAGRPISGMARRSAVCSASCSPARREGSEHGHVFAA